MTTVWLILAIVCGLMSAASILALIGLLAVFNDLRERHGPRGARLRIARLAVGAVLMATLAILAMSHR